MNIPKYIKDVLKCLSDNGFEGYMAGGCVRDSIMGNIPNDYDVTTNATPDEMLCAFNNFKVIPTGLKHGTVTVVSDGENIEVTTYRIDGEYVDNRHPQNVTFTSNLKDDLARRDFTVNAMAMDVDGNIMDFYGGKSDIQNKIIKCVGNPQKRFNEDGLRIMRCVRFASTLGFDIEDETAKAVHQNVHLLKNISKERIMAEMTKLILGKNAYKIISEFSDVVTAVVPFVNTDNIKYIKQKCDDLYVRLALLFDEGDKAQAALNELKCDNYTKKQVKNLIDANVKSDWDKTQIKKHLAKYGEDTFCRHILFENIKNNEDYSNVKNLFDEIISNSECYNISMLDIKGDEIINLGASGKQTGEVLSTLLDMVISEQIPNENKILIQKVKESMKI